MRLHSSRRRATMVAIPLALILGPNALIAFILASGRTLRDWPAWLPSARLELLAILAVSSIALAVVLSRLATSRRRAEAPVPTRAPSVRRGRFLPPLELVLLVIGNLTFLAFFAIIVVALLTFLAGAFRVVAEFEPLVSNSFSSSFAAVAAVMLLTLRRKALRKETWRRLSSVWLKWSFLVAVATAGLGMVGAAGSFGFLRLRLTDSQLPLGVMIGLYLALLACLPVVNLLVRAGLARAPGEESQSPLPWFVPAFGLAWTVHLGLVALYLNTIFLSLRAHVVPGPGSP